MLPSPIAWLPLLTLQSLGKVTPSPRPLPGQPLSDSWKPSLHFGLAQIKQGAECDYHLAPSVSQALLRKRRETSVRFVSELGLQSRALSASGCFVVLTVPTLVFGAGECPSVPAFLRSRQGEAGGLWWHRLCCTER